MREEFVQVLHYGGNYWLEVSTIGCPPSTVKVYDSLHSELPTQMKEQICVLLASQEPVIELIYVTVQSHKMDVIVGFLRWPMQLLFVQGRIPNAYSSNIR